MRQTDAQLSPRSCSRGNLFLYGWVEKGVYELNWGSGREHPATIPKLNRNVWE